MKQRVIIDYLRRWSWAYALGFICHVAAMWLAWLKTDTVIIASVFAGSAFVLTFESNRARGSRTFLSLPLTSRDLASAWRFVALEFPAALFFVALIVGTAIAALSGESKAISIERFTILMMLQTFSLGAVFFGFTGIPVNGSFLHGFREKLKASLFGLAFGATVFLGVSSFGHIPTSFVDFRLWHWAVVLALLLATVCGWLRAEKLVIRRAQFLRLSSGNTPSRAKAAGAPRNRQATKAALTGIGGLALNVIQFVTTVGAMGLLILGINWIFMQHFIPGGTKGDNSITSTQISFFMPVFSMISSFMMLNQLRVLRALPLRRGTLGGLLVLWPLGVALMFGVSAVVLHSVWIGGVMPWKEFNTGMLMTGCMLLVLPLVLRLGFSIKSFLVIFVMVPLMQAGQVKLIDSGDAEGSLVAQGCLYFPIVLAVAVGVWLLTCRLLASSYPWREGAMRMYGQRRF